MVEAPEHPLTSHQKLIQQSLPLQPRVALSSKLCIKVQMTCCTSFHHLQGQSCQPEASGLAAAESLPTYVCYPGVNTGIC